MSQERNLSPIDRLLMRADQLLRALNPKQELATRPSPAANIDTTKLNETQAKHAAGLMRVNHTGEICAQGLYHGQALTARLPEVRDEMRHAAGEEADHLCWCEQRLTALDSKPSALNPLFYAASFSVGALAGIAGDKWSLGFVAETEKQVCAHLDKHLQKLPTQDFQSRAVLEQMRIDEQQHAENALKAGGAELPAPIKIGMRLMSKVMTKTTYYF